MSYLEAARKLSADPEGLELACGQAVKSGAEAEFADAIGGCRRAAGEG